MTSKRRADIYLKAATIIHKRKEHYCCNAITAVNGRGYMLLEEYPEFYLFRPDHLPNAGRSDTISLLGWWAGDALDWIPEVYDEKVLVLLFAHAIALNP